MLEKFVPELIVNNFKEITLAQLSALNCQVLLVDLDNTLVAHDDAHPNHDVHFFLDKLRDAKIKVILISNNKQSRVDVFCADLRAPGYGLAYKPFKFKYKKIIKEYNLDKDTIVCLGDQILTDVLGAHRMNLKVIWTKPLVNYDSKRTSFSRFLEKRILKALSKKGLISDV
ncbi:MAG: YqeG family HAD IIIA-type phosphatase [Erysipelotrichaceae bacterium]